MNIPEGTNYFDPYEVHSEFDKNDNQDLESHLESNNILTNDYYAILNVSKDATAEEIKNSYKKLCIIYHPDKHIEENKVIAQKEFQKINKAYNILGNIQNKIIYDKYGEKGLEQTWELGPLLKTPEQILDEFEKQAKLKRELEIENLIKSKGEIKLIFNATGKPKRILSRQPYSNYGYGYNPMPPKKNSRGLADIFTLPKLEQSFIYHSWQIDVTPKDTICIAGNVFTHENIGTVNVIGTLSHTISSTLVGEVSTGVGIQPFVQGKLMKNFSSDCFVSSTATVSSVLEPPSVLIVGGRQLSPNYTGLISYSSGNYNLGKWGRGRKPREASSVALTLIKQKNDTQIQGELQVGIIDSHLRLSYVKDLTKNNKLRIYSMLSTITGGSIGISSDKKITKFSHVGLGLDCSSNNGLSVQLKYHRLGQTISLPVLISQELSLPVIFWGSLIPISTALLLDKYILNPYHKKNLQKKIDILKQANAEILKQRKCEAEEAITLMKEQVNKKIEIEKKNNGLIIIEALYGSSQLLKKTNSLLFKQQNKSSEELMTLPVEIIDVTIPVQSLINNSQLHIGNYSKSSIIGFYDPCFGEEKLLRIVYYFQGRIHLVELGETSPVVAPLREHLVNNIFPEKESIEIINDLK